VQELARSGQDGSDPWQVGVAADIYFLPAPPAKNVVDSFIYSFIGLEIEYTFFFFDPEMLKDKRCGEIRTQSGPASFLFTC
jgi:hypothetical protein